MSTKLKNRNKKIIDRYNAGESVIELCEAFNLSHCRINEIVRQMTWVKLDKSLDKKGTGPNFLKSTIQDLNLSTLTVNKLFRLGIYTIDDLESKLPDIENDQYLSKNIIINIKGSLEVYKNNLGLRNVT